MKVAEVHLEASPRQYPPACTYTHTSTFFPCVCWRQDLREMQRFPIDGVTVFAKYLRLEAVGKHGNEFYCPIRLVSGQGLGKESGRGEFCA